MVVPHAGAGAGAQGAGNTVGCEGQAEASSSLCSCTSKRPFILSWTTKPRPQEPLSDQSKEGSGCPGMGTARLGLLPGGSWQQVWGWDF